MERTRRRSWVAIKQSASQKRNARSLMRSRKKKEKRREIQSGLEVKGGEVTLRGQEVSIRREGGGL